MKRIAVLFLLGCLLIGCSKPYTMDDAFRDEMASRKRQAQRDREIRKLVRELRKAELAERNE
jgi:hypothetical protein